MARLSKKRLFRIFETAIRASGFGMGSRSAFECWRLPDWEKPNLASFPALVTILALALYIFTGIQVGRMRGLIGPRMSSLLRR
jgi:hypothetical protein